MPGGPFVPGKVRRVSGGVVGGSQALEGPTRRFGGQGVAGRFEGGVRGGFRV